MEGIDALTPEIGLWGWVGIGGILVFAFAVMARGGLKNWGSKFISVGRMILQLLLLGVYLGFLFEWNNPLVNLSWFLLMILAAGWSNAKSLPVFSPTILWIQVLALLIAGVFHLFVFNVLILYLPNPLEARFMIPIGGMILGNSLRGILLSQRLFLQSLESRKREWEYRLVMGESLAQLSRNFRASAFGESVEPLMATVANTGLVTIPGMMTGQLLGGNLPFTAVSYQLGIMVAILSAQVLATYLALVFLARYKIDPQGRILP